MIKVLVVEDSPVVREFLVYLLETDADIQVAGTADDGEAALAAVARLKPDVITMDIHMPKMDGLAATRRIMETQPTPIVIVSGSTDPHENTTTFRAMEAGALAVLGRPQGIGHPDHAAGARELLSTVKLMSEVKLVRRWPQARVEAPAANAVATAHSGSNGVGYAVRTFDGSERYAQRTLPLSPATALNSAALAHGASAKLIAIGASTGGPPVLQTILSMLPRDLPVPVLIVQHMAAGFTASFVEWLAQSSGLPVQLAAHGVCPLPGRVYVAPDEWHMKVAPDGSLVLSKDEAENGLRPSVGYLFRSLAAVHGDGVIAGLLTGMGRDGAAELKLLKEKGAITFAQDQASSVVHGMAGEAIRLDAASYVLAPDKIAAVLANLVMAPKGG
ncbi:MAG: chemotaxis-specific protein-glutamate methyltransferase CheB [Methylococcaceae bacterium]|nr:MAG: chemotaxis-specific protein-glutamate methyltransferase CheB [Methylococcaceae bacterium]